MCLSIPLMLIMYPWNVDTIQEGFTAEIMIDVRV